jgi:methylated-DNA-[protein]-cysteine S-methyltransferase
MNNTSSLARPAPLVAQATFDSPLGAITLVASEAGLAGAWFEGQKYHPGPLALPVDPAQRWLALAIAQLRDYFDGRLQRFELPLDLRGTPFQRGVWQALCGIAAGATTSYGALAERTGAPAAVRAVGAAVGRNPASVIVPCHRVLGRDGSLTGYAGGLHRKQALLALEGAL